jgi:hypothetical protein
MNDGVVAGVGVGVGAAFLEMLRRGDADDGAAIAMWL